MHAVRTGELPQQPAAWHNKRSTNQASNFQHRDKNMALDSKTVQDIARLARLKVSEQEIEKYASELSNILDLVAQMEATATDNIEPMTHPFDATLRMREDKITEHDQREKFQAIAPNAENGLYLVPKVID